MAAEPEFASYNAAKSGLIGLTKSMAVDLAPFGIITNCVAPGWTRTSLTEEYLKTVTQDDLDGVIPLGRPGEPSDGGEVVTFLCNPAVSYVVGQVISVDGGLLSKQPSP